MTADADAFVKKSMGIRDCFAIQRRVIGALLMREVLTRYGRHNIGFLWVFLEPMLFTLGVTALWTLTGASHGSSLPIVAFAVTGYSSVLLWRNMPNRCIGAVQPNLSLMYHRNVRIFDIFAARLLLEAGGATISFVGLSLLFSFVGWMGLPENPLKVAIAWVLLAWVGASLAIYLGAWAEQSDLVEKFWHPTSYLLFPLSGAAFMLDALPASAREILLFLPMVHAVELLREGYFGSAVRSHYSVSYLVCFALVLTLLGLARLRITSRAVVPE